MQKAFSLFLFLFIPSLFSSNIHGQSLDLGLTGYAKNLAIQTTSFLNREPVFLDISRLRVKGLVDADSWLHAELWLDTELLAGSYVSNPDFASSQIPVAPSLLDLDWRIAEGPSYVLRQQFFRAFASLYMGRTQVTIGRQRIAWGTGFAWNPTDLLNPFNPAAIELDEKAGIDAVHVMQPTGDFSRLELVLAPGRQASQGSFAARYGFHVGEYDISVMGGAFRKHAVVGGDFAGYLGNAGLRGEMALTFQNDTPALRAILNSDYNFQGGYYVMLEAYWNGPGASSFENYNYAALLDGSVFNLGRTYLAATIAKSLSPLTSLSLYALFNLVDGSSLAGPSLGYSLGQNLELAGAAYLFLGNSESEFGLFENAYFISLQWYF